MTFNSDKDIIVLQNIDLCNAAIDFTDLLSKSQKDILKYILLFNHNHGITANSIQVKLKITRQAAAIHLKRLMQRGFVTRKKSRVYSYSLNFQKMQELIKVYEINNLNSEKV